MRRVARRLDPKVRIERQRRLRVYKFSDGSRFRTRGHGGTFAILG
jgi:hypothetical protein